MDGPLPSPRHRAVPPAGRLHGDKDSDTTEQPAGCSDAEEGPYASACPRGLGVARCHPPCASQRGTDPQRASPCASRLPLPHCPVSLDVQAHPTSTSSRDLSSQGPRGLPTAPGPGTRRRAEKELASLPSGLSCRAGCLDSWEDVTPLPVIHGFSSFRVNKTRRPFFPGPTSQLTTVFGTDAVTVNVRR